MTRKAWLGWGLSAAFTWSSAAYPCTTFRLRAHDGASIFGRNMDYPTGVGFVSVNPRGRQKAALLKPGQGRVPAQWRAAYGSVAFSQYGRELPYGGMNEAGLVVEVMVLDDTVYPTPPYATPAVNEAGFVQYLLDTQDSVAGAVAAARQVTVDPLLVKLHYLACDATGACATFEWLDGALTVHEGDALPVAGMANSPYAASVASLSRYEGFGGREALPRDASSLSRFARMAAGQRDAAGATDAVAAAWRLLDDVKAPHTQWQVVYDQRARTVSFRTAAVPTVTTIALRDLDFACKAPFRAMDMEGTVTKPARTWFQDGVRERRALADATLARLGAQIPEPLRAAAAQYPDGTTCETP